MIKRSGLGPVEREIIHKIALDEMLPDSDVEDMVRAQFEFAQKTMEEAVPKELKYKNINLIKFGRFHFKEAKVYKVRANIKASEKSSS